VRFAAGWSMSRIAGTLSSCSKPSEHRIVSIVFAREMPGKKRIDLSTDMKIRISLIEFSGQLTTIHFSWNRVASRKAFDILCHCENVTF
jgi:hypothetical protein